MKILTCMVLCLDMAGCEIGSGHWPSLQTNDKVNKTLLDVVDKSIAIIVYRSERTGR